MSQQPPSIDLLPSIASIVIYCNYRHLLPSIAIYRNYHPLSLHLRCLSPPRPPLRSMGGVRLSQALPAMLPPSL